MGASWGFADRKAMIAHVAFANDPQALGVLRHFVRALHDAVLAADALVIEMADNAGYWIFVVGKDWTTVETGGVDAMVASGGDVLLNGRRANKKSDTAPCFGFVKTIERVTRGNAGFAAGTFFKVNFEGVLLPRLWLSKRNKTLVRLVARNMFPQIVPVGKLLDGGPLTLLGKQGIDKRARALLYFDR